MAHADRVPRLRCKPSGMRFMVTAKWVEEELARNYVMASTSGKKSMASEPRAKRACYDVRTDRVVIELTNGCMFAFPPALAQGLKGASRQALVEVKVTPTGYGLHWPQLDADLSVPDLIAGIFGTRAWMREMARRGGVTQSPAKAAAARENGKKGGRPLGSRTKRRTVTAA
jgi:Protein of unknown function (DUF2442)